MNWNLIQNIIEGKKDKGHQIMDIPFSTNY